MGTSPPIDRIVCLNDGVGEQTEPDDKHLKRAAPVRSCCTLPFRSTFDLHAFDYLIALRSYARSVRTIYASDFTQLASEKLRMIAMVTAPCLNTWTSRRLFPSGKMLTQRGPTEKPSHFVLAFKLVTTNR